MTKSRVPRTKLRPYEARAVMSLPTLLAKHRRVLAVAPTGAGKTVIAAALLRKLKGKRILWLAHRVELLQQAHDQIVEWGVPARDVGILSGTERANETARVLVASVAMFHGGRKPPKVDLVVIDEAHHVKAASYEKILKALPGARVLGLTATPQREDGEPLGDVFAHLHVMAEPVELVADRFLLPAVVYGVPQDKAARLVKGAGTGREYSAKKLEKALRKRPLMADIVKERARLAAGQPTIVYACTRAHGRSLESRFRASGVVTAYVDALTPPAERTALLSRNGLFASGKVEVVVNVGVLTEGFDCPPASCIVVARPTKSLVLWRQMCGRGARPSKGKGRRYLVLDHAGNVWRHGFPDSPMDWSLDGRAKQKGEQPLKLCPECEAVIAASARECPECGAEQPRSSADLAERQSQLEQARRRALEQARLLRALELTAKANGRSAAWVKRAANELGIAAA